MYSWCTVAGNVHTLPYLVTEISNLLQLAQAEVMLGQRQHSMYLASWVLTVGGYTIATIYDFPCGRATEYVGADTDRFLACELSHISLLSSD